MTTLMTAAGGGSATDAGGNIWSFGPLGCGNGEAPVLKNGAATGQTAAKIYFLTGQTVFLQRGDGGWIGLNGSNWFPCLNVGAGALPAQTPAYQYP